jgi:hypothetical protein
LQLHLHDDVEGAATVAAVTVPSSLQYHCRCALEFAAKSLPAANPDPAHVVQVLLQQHAAQVHEGILVYWATGGLRAFLVEYSREFMAAIAAVMEEVCERFIDGHEGDQSLPSRYRELPPELQAKWDMLWAAMKRVMQRVRELPLSGAPCCASLRACHAIFFNASLHAQRRHVLHSCRGLPTYAAGQALPHVAALHKLCGPLRQQSMRCTCSGWDFWRCASVSQVVVTVWAK